MEDVTIHVALTGDDRNSGSEQDPLTTIQAARDRVRTLRREGVISNIQVVLHGGTYFLKEPLHFSSDDSAPANSTTRYLAKPGATVVISGGVPLMQWKSGPDQVQQTQIARDNLPQSPLRQLFGPNQMYRRSRSPNDGYYRVVAAGQDRRTSFQVNPSTWQPNPTDVGAEVAMLHDWSMSRVAIARIDGTWVHLANRIGAPHDFFCIDGFEPNPRFFVEGSRTFFDDDREFYQDTDQASISIRNSNPAPEALVAPRLTELIRISGTETQPIRGLVFEGLQFRHTHADIPATGYAGIQASFFERRATGDAAANVDPATESGHSRLAAAVQCLHCQDCVFRDCQWNQLGGGGLYLDRESHAVVVEHCRFEDIGGCGVMIGETLTRPPSANGDKTCRDNVVRDSTVRQCGQILFGSVGIWIGIARNTTIENNEICDLPYSGVSIGWRWDDQPSGCHHNTIANNHIHHVIQVLSDGAGIYTLGRQPGTVLRGNRIHDVPLNAGRAESNGIFMDEGSTEIEVIENDISAIARSPIRFHRAGRNMIYSNQLTIVPGIEPYTFNATEPNVMDFRDNKVNQ